MILLPFCAEKDACDLFFCPEPKQSARQDRVWSVKQCQDVHGSKVCQHILFIHAIIGCDAWKRNTIKHIKYEAFCKLTDVFDKVGGGGDFQR